MILLKNQRKKKLGEKNRIKIYCYSQYIKEVRNEMVGLAIFLRWFLFLSNTEYYKFFLLLFFFYPSFNFLWTLFSRWLIIACC